MGLQARRDTSFNSMKSARFNDEERRHDEREQATKEVAKRQLQTSPVTLTNQAHTLQKHNQNHGENKFGPTLSDTAYLVQEKGFRVNSAKPLRLLV